MDKIMNVELTGKGDTYATVTLPLTPYEMLDTLDKLRTTPQDEPDWEICEFLTHRELHDWIGSGSVFELNALCTRLAELNVQESTVFEGLVEIEKEKDAKIIPMHRLLDLAYSTSQCHLLDDVHNAAQLGRFAAENGLVPNVELMSDALFEMLDFRQLGERFMRNEGGVIVRGGYVAQDGDLEQDVWKTMDLTPRKPDYTALVELTDTSTGASVKLSLPCDWREMDHKISSLIGREQHDYTCNCLDCRVPALCGMITEASNIAHANRTAEYLDRLPEAELPKYKALLAALDITELHEALDLTQRLDEYILAPEQASFEDIARGQLAVIMGEQEVETLLPHVNLYQYGRALQDRYQSVLTEYGSVERADNQPLMAAQKQEQPTMGGMEMTQG